MKLMLVCLATLSVTFPAEAQQFHKYLVESHTTTDDKDRGEAVSVTILLGTKTVAALNNQGGDLVYRNNTTNGWFLSKAPHEGGMMEPASLAECPKMGLVVSKSGGKGWKTKFSVWGMAMVDGKEQRFLLMDKTGEVLFGARQPIQVERPLEGPSGITRRGESGDSMHRFPFTCK